MHWLWRAGLIGVAGYVVLLGGLYLAQRRLIYYPDAEVPDRARAGATMMEDVRLATADGLDLLAWYAPARRGKPTVVVFHGNAGDIGHRFDKFRFLIDAGHGLLLVEYRGYGGNPGSPTEQGLYADADAALAFLVGRGVPPARTVLYGESLGSGPAIEAARRTRVGAVILEASFTSVADVAADIYWYVPARRLVLDRFDSAAKVGAIGCPLLILHGARDEVVPARFGRALHAAAREPKELWIAPEGDHNDLYDHGAGDVVLGFLAQTFR
ncbi:MAG: alpha/beta hydrolase [Alphaproteobacteria bacterium]